MQGIKRTKTLSCIRWGVLLVSLLFLAIGIAKQEYLEVLQKAVKICLECIGIG